MNRREALKHLGLSFGVVATFPAAFTFLQGCSKRTSVDWQPAFFTKEEGHILTQMVDIILPAGGQTPAASEVGVPEFIDQYVQQVVSLEEQDRIKAFFKNIISRLKQNANKDDALSLEKADIEPMIKRSLDKSESEEQEIKAKIANYVQSKQDGNDPELFDDVASYALITNIRGLAIWSYKTSKTVGEEILAYSSIPGEQQGCISVQEATGGKAWSL